MKRSFKNLFMIVMILLSLWGSGIQATPVQALGAMAQIEGMPLLPGGYQIGDLEGIWGADATHIFAVGTAKVNSGGAKRPLAYLRNGGAWNSTLVPLPTNGPGQNWQEGSLTAVWGFTDTGPDPDVIYVYAIGTGRDGTDYLPIVSQWNSSTTTWVTDDIPLPTQPGDLAWGYLLDVWGHGSEVYAVGYTGGGSSGETLPMVSRLSGGVWTSQVLDFPSGDHGYLRAVWSSGATIYAAGDYNATEGLSRPLLYYSTDGVNWMETSPALPEGWSTANLFGIWGSGTNDIYLVGSGGPGASTAPLLYHSTDGLTWTDDRPALPSGWGTGSLTGVWGSAFDDVYLVGTGEDPSDNPMPVLYHQTDGRWVASSYKEAAWTHASFSDIWGSAANDIYAVGSGGSANETKPALTQAIADTTAAGAVIGLKAEPGSSADSVVLTWTAPADDAGAPLTGPAYRYSVRFIKDSVGAISCSNGEEALNPPIPATPNDEQTMVISGLDVGEKYNFTVCTWDEENNPGPGAFGGQVSAIPELGGVGPGIYDDVNDNWIYAGVWTTYSGAGPANNTMHYTSAPGAYAQLLFSGTKFTLTYAKYSNRGLIKVYVDGSLEATLNANSALAWQQTWTSPTYQNGNHIVRLEHGGNGTYIDIDAIQIFGYVSPGIYDDANVNWVYSGAWTTYSGAGPASNTMHYTSNGTSSAELLFTGMKFTLTFAKYSNRGWIKVYVDGNLAATINANQSALAWQQTWTSPTYPNGNHIVRVEHGGNGTYIDIDSIQIFGYVPIGIYDDASRFWSYTGMWTTYSGAGPASNTMHYTSTPGDSAQLLFSGAKFILTFAKYSNRGSINVYVDGNLEATINANQPTLAWQQTWTSPTYQNGNHVLRIEHGGGDNTFIDIDSVRILVPVRAGKYDNTNANWIYSGAWTTYSGDGPVNNTMHYTSTPGSAAKLFFNGAKFILTFAKYSNRGTINVYVDDLPVETINANQSTLAWQQTWTSPTYPNGNHTLRLEHGGNGAFIDIDSIRILVPVKVGAYDDANANWAYSGVWTFYSGAGPANGTQHYTATPGGSAQLLFTGTKLTLTFAKYSNRGSIKVYVDGVLEATINANQPTLAWQQTWTSRSFGYGTHLVRVEQGGEVGYYIDVDSILIE